MSSRLAVRVRLIGVGACTACVALTALATETPTTDANEFFHSLVARYRGLSEYRDSVRLAHRTIENDRDVQGAPIERDMDCDVLGEKLAVRSSDVVAEALRSAAPLQSECDSSDGSPSARIRLACHLWALPHLSLRFAADPLRSMQGTGGLLVPIAVDPVTIDSRPLLRLHLESSAAPASEAAAKQRESRIDLFVNPKSMLVERVEESREIADGVRYEATIDIVPERAVPAPTAEHPRDEGSDDAPALIAPPKEAPARSNEPSPSPPASVPSLN